MKHNYTDEQLQAAALSQLRPIAEAGAVPEGCLRLYTYKKDGKWTSASQWPCSQDTHFVEVFLPYLDPEYKPSTEAAEPADPYAELKKAHAAGKVIQINCCTVEQPHWVDLPSPAFFGKPHEYRIKPEPDTFEAHGKTWTRHIPSDPMPCDGEVKIYCIGNMKGVTHEAYPANWWNWSEHSCVIGWRYADEPKQNLVPDQTQDVWTPQVGDVVRLKSGGPLMTVMQEIGYKFLCAYDSLGEVKTVCIPPDCLELSTKEDA